MFVTLQLCNEWQDLKKVKQRKKEHQTIIDVFLNNQKHQPSVYSSVWKLIHTRKQKKNELLRLTK